MTEEDKALVLFCIPIRRNPGEGLQDVFDKDSCPMQFVEGKCGRGQSCVGWMEPGCKVTAIHMDNRLVEKAIDRAGWWIRKDTTKFRREGGGEKWVELNDNMTKTEEEFDGELSRITDMLNASLLQAWCGLTVQEILALSERKSRNGKDV